MNVPGKIAVALLCSFFTKTMPAVASTPSDKLPDFESCRYSMNGIENGLVLPRKEGSAPQFVESIDKVTVDGRIVGWVYRTSARRSYLAANARMPTAVQQRYHLRFANNVIQSVESIPSRVASHVDLPKGFAVTPCTAADATQSNWQGAMRLYGVHKPAR